MLTLSQRHPGEMLPVQVIRLTQGQCTIVDPEDHEKAIRLRWHAGRTGRQTGTWYAQNCTWDRQRQRRRTIYLHKYLTGFPQCDHANQDGLDNRRVNLREATTAQNAANKGLTRRNTSGHRGVSPSQTRGKWRADIRLNGKSIYLGRFEDIQDAVAARREAEIRYFGEFAPIRDPVRE